MGQVVLNFCNRLSRVMLLLLVSVAARGEYPLQAGDQVESLSVLPGTVIRLFSHVPATATPESPVLFVMHGTGRDADRYLAEWRDLSDQYGFYLLVPEFSKAEFRGSARYNLGNVITDNRINPREQWSFNAIPLLFDAFRRDLGIRTTEYSIYGHSAGAQFVHRFLYHVPGARVRTYISANAGWYTLPSFSESWPYGLKQSALRPASLKLVLTRPMIVMLGDQDTDANDASLRQTSEAKRQGPHRFARGQFFMRRAERAARQVGVELAWRKVEVAGVAHSNRGMAVAAARLLYGETH
ncbi:MAG: hypothetical protein ACFHX7_25100 [Pseudomonadota bacterium]